MGSGIAQVFVENGFQVVLYDTSDSTLKTAKEKIENRTDRRSIIYTTNIRDCKADLCLEAIVENIDVKVCLLNQLLAINHNNTILATNTSSLSVTAIAENITAPERLAGIHFFNPAPLMKLVEVISTSYTTHKLIDNIVTLINSIKKTPVRCKDTPGFIVNRVARPYYLEALRLVELKQSSYTVIDNLMRSTGFKMGPFELMDLIGNDVNYAVSCIVYEALGKPDRLRPSVLQQQKVEHAALGRKTGKGYYEYPAK